MFGSPVSTAIGSGPGSGVEGTVRTPAVPPPPARERRVVLRRRGALGLVVLVDAGALAAGRRVEARRVEVLRVVVDALRRVPPAALRVRVAARRFVDAAARRVLPAARRVGDAPRDETLRATCCTCLLMPSSRLSALSTSACLAARCTCVETCLIAARKVFSLFAILRSSCRRRSLGTRLSASRSARRPALTARPTMPDRLDRADVRFLFAILQPPITTVGGALDAPH